MAQVRHIVTPPGKAPVEFFAPEDANDGQLQVLASRALAAQYPSESFVTPVLDPATRASLEQPERQLTQPEILARQGEISSRDPSYRERDIEGLTSALSKVGFSDMARAKASGLVNDVYDWTPVGSAEAADEAIRDAGGGRYLDAAGNALVAGLDVIPEVKGLSALAAVGLPGIKRGLKAAGDFSPVTDEAGNPLRLYHGGDQQIHEVASDYYGDSRGFNMFPNSFFLTPDREMAATYGDEITHANVQLKNPYVVDSNEKWDFLERHEDPSPELMKQGYDGAIIKADDGGPDEYVIFSPDQFRRLEAEDVQADMSPPDLTPVGPSREAMKTAKQLSTMAGSPAGANKKATTRQVKKLSEDYLRQVDQGKEGADWYEKSGRSIMYHMGEDEPAAVKLAGAIGVTSARTPVLPNLEHGVRGHYQMLAGDPAKTGGFPTAMGKSIEQIYGAPDIDLQGLRDIGNEAFGPKRTPFIQQNLMYEGFEPGQQSTARAVHDIWDMRARAYSGKDGRPFDGTPSTAQHRWADLQDQGYLIPEANARQIGGRADWDTGRLQAAAWVGNKIDALMREGKSFAEAQKIAATDYSDAWSRLYANHSWESAPGSNTGHMTGFDDLPWEAKKDYHSEVETAFLNPEGQSNIALGLGMPTGQSYDTTGLYEGVVSPGTQDQVAVARQSGGQGIDPSSGKMMNALANIQGVLGAQKGAAWNFQSPTKSTIKGATGFRFDTGQSMRLEDVEQLGPRIQAAFPAGNVGLLPDPTGLKIVKFWDEEGDDLPGFVKQLQADTGLPKPFPTTQSGNYMENAWDKPEGRFGGQYVNALQGLGIPDIERKFDSFAPGIARRMVEDIDPSLMKRVGLTGSADIERLRKTIANEGWQGLVRLVESQKGSVDAKAALLAAAAGLAGAGVGVGALDEAQQ